VRIAWTGPVAPGAGVPAMGLLMLEELLRQGVEVDLYTPRYSFESSPLETQPGLRIIERRTGWRWGRWYSRTKALALFSGSLCRTISYATLSLRLLAEHRRRPYDAIYQLSMTELFFVGWLRRLAPPIVVHPCTHHGGELRWHRAEQSYALAAEHRFTHMLMRGYLKLRSRVQPAELGRADLVLGLSDRFNELLHADYGVPIDKLSVVRTPVDLTRFTPGGPTSADRRRTLLYISRISARKGVDEIIQLSHRLADQAESVRLVVIGGATQWSDYRKHLERLNPDVAEYLGGMANEDLPALLRSATMLLVPSAYEPGSIATAEALACGLPVVLSDEVGNGEVVQGPHVRFHRPGDVDGLEAAVRSLLQAMEHDGPALRAAARANAEEEFSPHRIVAQLIELLASSAGPSTFEDPDRSGVSLTGPTPDRRAA
jgi:glycosyltransferase involved in cell wall biosynthesis